MVEDNAWNVDLHPKDLNNGCQLFFVDILLNILVSAVVGICIDFALVLMKNGVIGNQHTGDSGILCWIISKWCLVPQQDMRE